MTIFAQQSAIRFSSQPIDLSIAGPIPDASILVFDATKGAFVIKDGASGQPYITGATNLGATNAIGVFSNKNVNLLEFKELIAGNGVNITDSSSSLTFTVNNEAGILSVPEDYTITIDNDNSGTTAKFEVLTAVSTGGSPIIVTPTVVVPVTATTLTTGNDITLNKGFYRTTNGIDFIANGFLAGMYIDVLGTDEQDGQFQIDSIVNTVVGTDNLSTIFITTLFTGTAAFDLGGPQPSTVFTQHDLFVPDPDPALPPPYLPASTYKISSFSLDFGPSGLNFVQGMILKITGTEGAAWDGNFTINSVTAKGTGPFDLSVILFEPTSPVIGPLGIIKDPTPTMPSIVLTIADFTTSTGFFVLKDGSITATTGSFLGQATMGTSTKDSLIPVNNNDLVRKDFIDSLAITGSKAVRYFFSFF